MVHRQCRPPHFFYAPTTFSDSVEMQNVLNSQLVCTVATISSDMTMPAGYNSILNGPITIADGTSLTISSTANVRIKDISDG